MPRRSATPSTIGAEDALRERIRHFLEEQERGGSWFARQMQARGCESFTNVTLHKVLKGGRTIYFNEGVAMAAVMGIELDEAVR